MHFVRQYGPGARNDSMYDESIQRAAKRAGISPLNFVHPYENELLALVQPNAAKATSIVLTGTAGDGKSRLCARLWDAVGGNQTSWYSSEIYHETTAEIAGKRRTVGVIRDLTALPEDGPYGDYADKQALLEAVSRAFLEDDPSTIYIVAANDGQLMDVWRRLGDSGAKTRALLEDALVDGRQSPTVAFIILAMCLAHKS